MQNMPFMEQPEEILVPLLPYQRQFLAWGVSQEQSSVRGGILADEMGMGKTLQVSLPASAMSARDVGYRRAIRELWALQMAACPDSCWSYR